MDDDRQAQLRDALVHVGPEREVVTVHDMVAVAAQWLTSNPQVRERAVAGCKAIGKLPVDAFVTDPALVVDAIRSVVIQAVELDAPVGVVESLLAVLRPMVATLNQREQWRYSFERIGRLEGPRDPSEVVPVLEEAVAEAPDAANEARLRGCLDAFQRTWDAVEATTLKAVEVTVDQVGFKGVLCYEICLVKSGTDVLQCPICLVPINFIFGDEDPFPNALW